MKILHVLDHSVPHNDGYCIRSQNIVHFQQELGWEPIVVTSPHQEPIPSKAVETFDGVRYYRTAPYHKKRLPFLHEAHAIRRLKRRIGQAVQLESPELIHTHSPCTWGFAAWRFARRCRLPFIYEVRGLWQGQHDHRKVPFKYRVARRLETLVARHASAVTTIAHHLRSDLIGRGVQSDRVFVVPNGVDLEKFTPRMPDEGLIRDLGLTTCLRIGYLGSLYEFEGVEDLVSAVYLLRKRCPQAKLLILGAGPRQPALRELIDTLGIADSVRLLGRVPHHDISRYYSIMDVVVYPRKRGQTTETVTPLKPLEAMAMAKAIIASDVGGLRELLTDECSLFFPPGDARQLAERCAQLCESREQRLLLGERARQHAAETRDWSHLIQLYEPIYEMACQNGESTRSVPRQ